jgi:hypothetical protein
MKESKEFKKFTEKYKIDDSFKKLKKNLLIIFQ